MKIVVITGSPHKRGTSNYLVENFIKGAKEADNEVFRFDSAFSTVHPCLGCNVCRKSGDCVWNDSFNDLKDKLVSADYVVFATPIYYMNMTAQLKAVIDRFYQLEMKAEFKNNKKYIVLATAWNKNPSVFDTILQNLDLVTRFLKWNIFGEVIVSGVDNLEDIQATNYAKTAYELGLKIKTGDKNNTILLSSQKRDCQKSSTEK